MTTTAEPAIRLWDIPGYFGGGSTEGAGTQADHHYNRALEALISLTGRSEDDPAIRFITGRLDDAKSDLLNLACNFGRCIPDGLDAGIDEWDDDVLFGVTGHQRPPVWPDTPA